MGAASIWYRLRQPLRGVGYVMAIIERHKSADGLMELIVDLTDGDWTVGFEGYPWHTHGDILDAWGYEGPPEKKVRAFVTDVLDSKRVIVVTRIDGKVPVRE